jgi:hypothetical protein
MPYAFAKVELSKAPLCLYQSMFQKNYDKTIKVALYKRN